MKITTRNYAGDRRPSPSGTVYCTIHLYGNAYRIVTYNVIITVIIIFYVRARTAGKINNNSNENEQFFAAKSNPSE